MLCQLRLELKPLLFLLNKVHEKSPLEVWKDCVLKQVKECWYSLDNLCWIGKEPNINIQFCKDFQCQSYYYENIKTNPICLRFSKSYLLTQEVLALEFDLHNLHLVDIVEKNTLKDLLEHQVCEGSNMLLIIYILTVRRIYNIY